MWQGEKIGRTSLRRGSEVRKQGTTPAPHAPAAAPAIRAVWHTKNSELEPPISSLIRKIFWDFHAELDEARGPPSKRSEHPFAVE